MYTDHRFNDAFKNNIICGQLVAKEQKEVSRYDKTEFQLKNFNIFWNVLRHY